MASVAPDAASPPSLADPFDGAQWSQDPFASSSSSDELDEDDLEDDGRDGLGLEREVEREIGMDMGLSMREQDVIDDPSGMSMAEDDLDPPLQGFIPPPPPGSDSGGSSVTAIASHQPLLMPRLSRAFSMPLPAQLRHLQHPLITVPTSPSQSQSQSQASSSPSSASFSGSSTLFTTPASIERDAYFTSLSLELADSVQPIIQTLLQLSPPHILDPAKEQFSPCTVQFPTASVSGLLTAMKGLNFLSANLAALPPKEQEQEPIVREKEDFDIGELLQSVGDVLGGLAAQAGVDLVLYHGDAGMLHVSVRGDEGAVAYALTHVLRQILATSARGDSLEVGLHLGRALPRTDSTIGNLGLGLGLNLPASHLASPPSPASSPSSPHAQDDAILCTFDITHRIHISPTSAPGCPTPNTTTPQPSTTSFRPLPNFSGQISTRLLASIRASLSTPSPDPLPTPLPVPTSPLPVPTSPLPAPPSPARRTILAVPLLRGAPLVEPPLLLPADAAARQPFPAFKLAREPTLAELDVFAHSSLRNRRAFLYASPRSAFARHVTSYLTSWAMDVVHVPTDGAEELGLSCPPSPVLEPRNLDDPAGIDDVPEPPGAEPQAPAPQPSFVIIDDDVTVLRRRLVAMRAQPPNLYLPQGKAGAAMPPAVPPTSRPSLATNHRPRSNPQQTPRSPIPTMVDPMANANAVPPAGPPKPKGPPESVVIIHFTSLANFKLVRDAVQTLLTPTPQGAGMYASFPAAAYAHLPHGQALPDVLVVPKPAGPRRLLTALHTAVQKPVVDPFFAPIATSPQSPAAANPFSPFFNPTSQSDLASPPSAAGMYINHSSNKQPRSPGTGTTGRMHLGFNGLGGLGERYLPTSPLAHPLEYARVPTGYSPPTSTAVEPAMDYFPETAVKIGNNSSSGVILQSPDGRPAGVFFQPASRTNSGSIHHHTHTAGGGGNGTSGSRGGKESLNTRPLQRENSSRLASQPERRRSAGGSHLHPGTIFSASQVLGTYSSGTPTDVAPTTRPLRRVHTVATPALVGADGNQRPFLLPGPTDDIDSGDQSSSALLRGRGRRIPSGSTTVAASIPLPPSRPGSTRIPSGGSARSQVQRAAPRRNSGQVLPESPAKVNVNNPAPTTPGPSPPPEATTRDDESISPLTAARANIRKLIQAGTSALPVSTPGTPDVIPDVATPIVAATSMSSPSVSTGAGTGAKAVARRSINDVSINQFKKTKTVDNVIVPPINVLIVEDNPINQTILTTFMRRKKIKYGTAMDGQEAVDKWKTGGFHLILMDIQMPVMDGIEATKEIRRLESASNLGLYPTTPTTPPADLLKATSPLLKPATPGAMPSSPHRSSVIIVALTASSLQSDRVNALAAGCNDFLTKPVSLKWLEKKIIEWGSIKALQMWADSAITKGFSSGQAARATQVREQLRIDRTSQRNTPSPGPPKDASRPEVTITSSTPDPTEGKVHQPVPLSVAVASMLLSSNAPGTPGSKAKSSAEVADEPTAFPASSATESYFPSLPAKDAVSSSEEKARTRLLSDVLEDSSGEDSPAETVKASPPPEDQG